jgi:hypothetical protein
MIIMQTFIADLMGSDLTTLTNTNKSRIFSGKAKRGINHE